MPLERKQLDFGPLLPASVGIDNPSRDYTPPQVRSFCTQLLTSTLLMLLMLLTRCRHLSYCSC